MTERKDISQNSLDKQQDGDSRRSFLQGAAAVATTASASGAAAKSSKAPKNNPGTPIAQQPLPFAEDALAPVISANTLGFHYGKHYKTYCDNVAKAVAGTPLASAPLEEIIANAASDPAKKGLFNNAAQAWNHVFYWNSLSPKAQTPSGKFLKAIEADFGSLDALKTALGAAATGQFASGWAWLVSEGGKLKVTSTSNADLPMVHDQHALLTLDVWEHAYYLDYQNKRADYVKAVIDKTLNWDFAAANYEAA